MTTKIEVLYPSYLPTVMISVAAMAKVQQYVAQSEKEVGWMGQMDISEGANGSPLYTLENPYAPAQEVSHATTDLDADGPGSFADWFVKLGCPENVKWWGHSHVHMGVNPSGTDLKTFIEHTEHDPDNPFVMTIHNKRGEIYTNIYLGHGVYIEDGSIRINYGSPEIEKLVAEELLANVREKTYGVGFNAPNGSNTNKQTGKGKGKRAGSGSNRKSRNKPASKERNAKRNAVGLRSNRESQHSQSVISK